MSEIELTKEDYKLLAERRDRQLEELKKRLEEKNTIIQDKDKEILLEKAQSQRKMLYEKFGFDLGEILDDKTICRNLNMKLDYYTELLKTNKDEYLRQCILNSNNHMIHIDRTMIQASLFKVVNGEKEADYEFKELLEGLEIVHSFYEVYPDVGETPEFIEQYVEVSNLIRNILYPKLIAWMKGTADYNNILSCRDSVWKVYLISKLENDGNYIAYDLQKSEYSEDNEDDEEPKEDITGISKEDIDNTIAETEKQEKYKTSQTYNQKVRLPKDLDKNIEQIQKEELKKAGINQNPKKKQLLIEGDEEEMIK